MTPRLLTALVSGLCGTCGLLGIHSGAQAYTVTHGATCRAGGTLDGDKVFLVASSSGITNYSLTTLQVVCPMARTDPSDGFTVWVDGYSGVAAVNCTLYSRSANNVLLGANSSSASAGFNLQLTLPSSQVPRDSSQVVVCGLPSGGNIWDIRSVNAPPFVRFPGRSRFQDLLDDLVPLRPAR